MTHTSVSNYTYLTCPLIFSYVNLYPQGNIALMHLCDSNQVLTVFVEFASPVIGSEKDDKWAGSVWALELLLD